MEVTKVTRMEVRPAEGIREDAPSPAFARWRAGIGWGLVALVVWLVHFQVTLPYAPPELDPSWQQGLMVALARGIHFGSELVFTFGPLGGPAVGRYQPEIFWQQFWLFHVLFMGVVAVRWAVALSRWKSTTDVVLFVVALCSLPLGIDSYFMATAVVLAVSHLGEEPRSRRLLLLDAVILAACGYVKFTYFFLGAGLAALITLHSFRRKWRDGIVAVGTFALAYVLAWLACDQRFVDLPLFVVRSANLAAGYSEAQAWDGDPIDVRRGLWMLVAVAVVLLVYVATQWKRRGAILTALAVAGGTFVAFRANFTFHSDRAPTFFAFCSVACVALWPAPSTRTYGRVLLAIGRVAILFLAVRGFTMEFAIAPIGSTLVQGADLCERAGRMLLDVPAHEAGLIEEGRKLEAKYALPRIRAAVGSSTIDALGANQAWIFLNGLQWKPRPVFQSYVTTTPEMMRLNGAFYEGADAPEFLILDLGSIMERTAGMDDSAVLNVVLARYVPVVWERGILLMQRDPSRAARVREGFTPVKTLVGKPGETLRIDDVEGRLLRLRFDVQYSLLGKLRRALYHAPVVSVHVTDNDGGTRAQRLNPGQASTGILVRPHLEFGEDWVDAYTRGATKKVLAFRLGSPNAWDPWLAPTYTVVVDRCDDLLPEPDESRRNELIYGSFPTRPMVAITPSGARYFYYEEREYVLVGPNARLVFPLRAGARHLSGFIGLLGGSENGDGVDFKVSLVRPLAPPETIWARTLDRNSKDMTRSALDLDFVAQEGDRLLISTSNPPERTLDWDMAILESIEIR